MAHAVRRQLFSMVRLNSTPSIEQRPCWQWALANWPTAVKRHGADGTGCNAAPRRLMSIYPKGSGPERGPLLVLLLGVASSERFQLRSLGLT